MAEIAGFFEGPVCGVEVAFYFYFYRNGAGVANFDCESADFIPAGDIVVAVKFIVVGFEVHKFGFEDDVGYGAEI